MLINKKKQLVVSCVRENKIIKIVIVIVVVAVSTLFWTGVN